MTKPLAIQIPEKQFYFFSIILLLNSFAGDLFAQTGNEIPELRPIDLEIKAFINEWNLPGGSVAVVKDGRLLYARAFGKADISEPMKPDHLFRIASLSKPITAIAIMQLVEEGLLELEDKVFGERGVLNGAPFDHIVDERIKNITIEQLLQHTAGWDRNRGAEGDPMFNSLAIAKEMGVNAPASSADIIRYMLTKKLDFNPGTRFSYSNLGYCILGRVVERISGRTYEAYVTENILDPLEIVTASLGCNAHINKQAKEVVYYAHQEMQVASVCEPGEDAYYPYGGFNLEAMDAHGGWIASATDLAKIMVASGGLGTERDLLSQEAYSTMIIPSNVYPNYGLGWFVNDKGSRWHTGSLVGASSMMASLSSGIGWVMLFNGNPMSSAYFNSMDKVMGRAISQIQDWPSDDLFVEGQDDAPEKFIEKEFIPGL